MMTNLIYAINSLFEIYFWIILVRCLLSFVPTIDWYKQPFTFIKDSTDIYLNLFRKIIPPVNGLDFSPIVAIIVLQIIQYAVVYLLLLVK